LVDRFHCSSKGASYATAFSELNDPEDQADRFAPKSR